MRMYARTHVVLRVYLCLSVCILKKTAYLFWI
jgi:hypothetical protein